MKRLDGVNRKPRNSGDGGLAVETWNSIYPTARDTIPRRPMSSMPDTPKDITLFALDCKFPYSYYTPSHSYQRVYDVLERAN